MKKNNCFDSPPLAITMGCPVGIGPEIIVKTFIKNPELAIKRECIVLGSFQRLREVAVLLGVDVNFVNWSPENKLSYNQDDFSTDIPAVLVYDIPLIEKDELTWGNPNAVTGKASFEYVAKAIDFAMAGVVRGIVTAPISKHGLQMAGINYPGHTEILASRTGTESYAMMLAGRQLRVVLVTIHCPLSQVSNQLTVEKVFDTLNITNRELFNCFGVREPEILIAGLNPHAGEEGMFGCEEKDIIEPAVIKAREAGINVLGPYPPDTLFYKSVNGSADAVVCMYHDQGLIPFKLLHFRDGVNITLGLPIVRTSVDHGTAYDIAGTGKADSTSLEEAVRVAKKMSSRHE